MNNIEKAKEFALHALKEQISVIERAYLQGFEDGKTEVLASGVFRPFVMQENDIEWHDFGLPSGDIWGFCKQEVTRLQAMPYDIPAFANICELVDNCRIRISGDASIMIDDLNGVAHSIDLVSSSFWIKSYQNGQNKKYESASFFHTEDPNKSFSLLENDCYPSDHKQLFLIKKRE